MIYGLISSSGGWGVPKVYGSLAGAGVLLVAFLAAEIAEHRPMLDLTLFRKPTFTGGLLAAFGLNASIYSVFTYLVLYLQEELGFSAAQTGVRFLALTAPMFVSSTLAGRLTHVVPVRLMIGTGFVLVSGGIWLMYGVSAASGWTHLLPGMVVAGVGIGRVTVPLASTAVGVVPVARAGMASGINLTLRQVGLSTGIAVLGSVFTARLGVGRAGYAAALNDILVIGACVALVSAVLSYALIRRRDFVPPAEPAPASRGSGQDSETCPSSLSTGTR